MSALRRFSGTRHGRACVMLLIVFLVAALVAAYVLVFASHPVAAGVPTIVLLIYGWAYLVVGDD